MVERIINFNAGPSLLPRSVLLEAQASLLDFEDTGIGILEHSHRHRVFDSVIEECEALCRKIAGISEDYAILFLQGGATMQFSMIPMAFLDEGKHIDVIHTGFWTGYAIEDASRFGEVHVAYDGSLEGFSKIPKADEIHYSKDSVYRYYCSNNTFMGTEWVESPSSDGGWLVSDMSSNIFSRCLDLRGHGMVFASAQKNLGIAGVSLVIIHRDFLELQRRVLGRLFDYRSLVDARSMLNTPPCFGIYMMYLVLKWILSQGGLEEMDKRAKKRSSMVHQAIDDSGGFYRHVGEKGSQSRMNVCFQCANRDLEKVFVEESIKAGMNGLAGHRRVGGLRASMYNAFKVEDCKVLVDFMGYFKDKMG